MFEIDGTSTYPDATFTLRFSYGTVKGYRENGRDIAPITTIGGAFARATGNEPFRLPDSWIAARAALDLEQPFNFVTTNDIIEGNSGSPVVNKEAELVGLIFDGNYASLGGDFGFDPEQTAPSPSRSARYARRSRGFITRIGWWRSWGGSVTAQAQHPYTVIARLDPRDSHFSETNSKTVT